ncbi:MAG: dehydrogenase, partial [Coriobacteriia bacterium]|nr:dehydrogenase [Coriobacteriia bacterium]
AGANAPSADPALAYTLITGARRQPYWASSFFNNPEFRRRRPDPTVQISAATAAQAGLADGQWARLRTRRGTACFKVQVAELVDGVLSAEYGWWYPEEAPGEPHLSGLWRSNVNILTEADPAGCEPLIGSWTYNGIPCTIQALDTGSD